MSFFRMSIYICIGLIVLTMTVTFIDSLGAFPVQEPGGMQITDRNDTLYKLTGLTGGWNAVWLMLITITGGAAIVLAWAIGSFIPISIYIFGAIFWTSYTRAYSVLSFGGYIPEGLLLIVDVVVLFVFIAGCLGIAGAGE